ncbi:prolyl oligopeptidase family serine peptidase [Rossellomorea vietnamensis]|uniref:Prolyl oligopeptidase family serine peptidase n=1 Tax=Rossellomorea vietnamensis TaxID=218284 RepID=A0A6I6UUH8_9BACI|nr:alpha/beta fold hydrolase [Rossellomorea vietnamensis]QHE63281.1 prolyl oligopeptidase family serine peptidase [Rossellomorea vietnamensis]
MGRKVGDFPLEVLREYKPELKIRPKDFEVFWFRQKERMSGLHPIIHSSPRAYPVPSVEVIDLVLESWDGTPLNGLLVKPVGVKECPVIVCFHGYTGSRGLPSDYLKWTALGVAVYSFDVRGQGTSPDYAKYGNGSRIPGWMLHGILDEETYYYTNVYRDILVQLKWVKSADALVIPTTLGVMGSSQGGGLALVAAGLEGDLDYVVSDWPFLTHFDRALDIALQGPYMEIVDYFKWNDPQYESEDKVKNTLGMIDSLHFCESITCPVLMGVGMEDAVTPPSTVFAAFNHLSSIEKQIEVYPQFTHEMNSFHDEKKLAFISKQLSEGGGS